MGGFIQLRTLSWCLGGIYLAAVAILRVSAAEPLADSWLPPQSTVVLFAGLPGDVESQNTYRDQLQGWLDFLASVVPPPSRVFVLWENPWTVTPPARLSVQVLNPGREEFLSLARTLAGPTNPLVVIAWGHGGMQGKTPVFHVRGPRLTPADFKSLAGATPGESKWMLFFRGSGRFAAELAGERREVISSDHDTPFTSDPISGPLALKLARGKAGSSFLSLADELGRAVGLWYEERHLARTEEPTLWRHGAEARHLVSSENSGATTPVDANKPATPLPKETPAPDAPPAELPAVWKEITRVEPQKFPEADAMVLRRRVSFTLGTAPAIASEHEEFVQILTADGKRFGDFDVSFSPPEEEVEFLDCEVLRADGRLLRLDPEDIRDSTEPALGDYRTARQKYFSLPGVAPGAVIRVRYRTEWKSYPLPHVSLSIPLGGEVPIVESTMQVTVPKDSAFHFLFEHTAARDPEIRQSTHGSIYTWQFKDVPASIAEALAPPNAQPMLLVSTFPDWASFAEWFARITKGTDEITPELSDRAKKLTRDAASDRGKIRALYEYVCGLRYVAVPLGVNSHRPHAAASVFRNQFGDCKDKANLFNTLLHSLGFDARLVLVPRFSQAHEALPGLAFNHAISRVKLGDELLWLDTTDEVCRFGMLPPGDPGRNVLVIDGQSTKLTPLPRPLAREHRLQLHARVKVETGEGASTISVEASGSGIVDYELRGAARELKDRAQNLPLLGVQFRNSVGTFTLATQTSTPPSKLDEDFAWRAEGDCVGLVSQDGARQRLRAPFWVPNGWDAALHGRKSPLFLNRGYPLTLEEEIDFVVPRVGASAKFPPQRDVTVGPLRWKINWSKTDGGLRATLHVELESGELAETDSRRFQNAWRELLTVLAGEVTFSADL